MDKYIILKSLRIKNFKGIKQLNIDFSRVTNIYGENATGKTTIFDAFTWLLFDKDSRDKSNFEIKTLDLKGDPVHGLDHEVEGILNIAGKDLKLSKKFKEKWTKKKGEAEKQLTGHETLYYIDEVPVKKSEYQEAISNIIDENIFKLITNPLYFSFNMKWQDRRKILIDIIGDISIDRIINYKNDLRPLEKLLGDKDIDTFKRSISARRKKLNDDIKGIPPRIDELNNSIQELDFDTLDFQRRGILGGIKDIEEKLMDRSKVNEDILKEKDRLFQLKSKLKEMEFKASLDKNKPLEDLKFSLNKLINDIHSKEFLLQGYQNTGNSLMESIEKIKTDLEALRKKWYEVNSKELTFDENTFICPTCKRPFDEDESEHKKNEMIDSFNLNKAGELKTISDQGAALSSRLKSNEDNLKDIVNKELAMEKSISEMNFQKQQLENGINRFEPEDLLINNEEYQDLKKQIEELEDNITVPAQSITDITDFKEKRKELELELQELNKKLSLKEQNEKFRARIQELMEEEKALAQQIADIEKQEYLCDEFLKTKVELLESSINSKFQYVSFKLFDTQVNGGLNETCEALINGVPYSNANTAAQINAGLDIINALSKFYSVQAPIFIDNRESVNQLIATEAQIINLIVSTDKNLRMEAI